MPIYEYECVKCGHVHEALQKISDKPLTECPLCSGRLQKLISQSSFHLKGSGWYATDYANNAVCSKPAKNKTGEAGTQSNKSPAAPKKEEDF